MKHQRSESPLADRNVRPSCSEWWQFGESEFVEVSLLSVKSRVETNTNSEDGNPKM